MIRKRFWVTSNAQQSFRFNRQQFRCFSMSWILENIFKQSSGKLQKLTDLMTEKFMNNQYH